MKTVFASFLLLIVSVVVFAQQERTLESRITDVTVFLSRAQIFREAKTRLEPGKSELIFAGLTSMLDPQSIQVSGRGSFIILGIRHRQNYRKDIPLPRALQQLKDSVEILQRLIALTTAEKDIITKEEQMILANQKIGGANQNVTAAELKAMADFYRTRLTELASGRIRSDEKILRYNERHAKLQAQLHSESDLYFRNTSEIVVSVSAEAPTSAELTLNYMVSNAGWHALYDLRAINTKNPVQLNYKANVYQSTGEEWKNVHLKLSTANPNLGGLKPALSPWFLDIYSEPALQEVVVSGYPRAKRKAEMAAPSAYDKEVMKPEETESIADFTQVVQTSLNTEFDIALPYSISSSNKPVLVDVKNHTLQASYQYSAVPKLDSDAFLMAQATGWEALSLLPGEANVFFEGTFVGKTNIDPNVIKDTLAISLGRDKRIVIKRERTKDFTSKKLIGSNQREAFGFEISVRNAKTEPIEIVVEDQIPISQTNQIEVTMIDQGTAKYNKQSGKLTWQLNLKAGESTKVQYKFEVKYPKDRLVVGL